MKKLVYFTLLLVGTIFCTFTQAKSSTKRVFPSDIRDNTFHHYKQKFTPLSSSSSNTGSVNFTSGNKKPVPKSSSNADNDNLPSFANQQVGSSQQGSNYRSPRNGIRRRRIGNRPRFPRRIGRSSRQNSENNSNNQNFNNNQNDQGLGNNSNNQNLDTNNLGGLNQSQPNQNNSGSSQSVSAYTSGYKAGQASAQNSSLTQPNQSLGAGNLGGLNQSQSNQINPGSSQSVSAYKSGYKAGQAAAQNSSSLSQSNQNFGPSLEPNSQQNNSSGSANLNQPSSSSNSQSQNFGPSLEPNSQQNNSSGSVNLNQPSRSSNSQSQNFGPSLEPNSQQNNSSGSANLNQPSSSSNSQNQNFGPSLEPNSQSNQSNSSSSQSVNAYRSGYKAGQRAAQKINFAPRRLYPPPARSPKRLPFPPSHRSQRKLSPPPGPSIKTKPTVIKPATSTINPPTSLSEEDNPGSKNAKATQTIGSKGTSQSDVSSVKTKPKVTKPVSHTVINPPTGLPEGDDPGRPGAKVTKTIHLSTEAAFIKAHQPKHRSSRSTDGYGDYGDDNYDSSTDDETYGNYLDSSDSDYDDSYSDNY